MNRDCYTTGSAKSSENNALCRCRETTAQVDSGEIPGVVRGAVPGVLARLVAGGFALAEHGGRLRVLHPTGQALPDDLRQAVKACRGALLDLIRPAAAGDAAGGCSGGGRERLARLIWRCIRQGRRELARLLLDQAVERAAICEIDGGLARGAAWAVAASDAELALGEGW